MGLYTAIHIAENGVEGEDLCKVVIKSDSEYLVKGMTDWVFKWKENGYRTAKGKPVTNMRIFQRLDELVERLNEMNVEVQFWYVLREFNKDADGLVNTAFDKN